MSRRRGLVVQRSGDKVTAITKDGEFVTWRDRRDLMPGEEVPVPSRWFQTFVWRRLIPATALATVLIVSSFFGYRHYLFARPVLAYVTFDSSGEVPVSIELEVNDRGLVRRAVPLDEAGASALQGINVEMQPVQTVLVKLRQAIPESKVIVAFIPVTEAEIPESPDALGTGREDSLFSKVMGLAQRVFDSIQEATAVMLDMETRAVAQELGISAGRAASWALWNLESEASQEAIVVPWVEEVPDPGQAEPGVQEPVLQEPGDPVFTAEPFSTQVQEISPTGEGDDEPISSQPTEGISGHPAGSGTPGQREVPSHPVPPGAGAEPSPGTAGTQLAEPGASTSPDGFEELRVTLPPGQQKKVDPDALLGMIKSGLPDFKWTDDEKPLSKKSAKELEKLTKEWLNSLLEASKKASQKDKEKYKDRGEKEDDHKKPASSNQKPETPNGASGGNKGGNKKPGKGQENPGKPRKEEKSGKPGGADSKGKNEKHDDDKGKGSKGGTGSSMERDSDHARDDKKTDGKSAGLKQATEWEKSDKSPAASGKYGDWQKDTGQDLFSWGDRLRWTSEFLRRLWK